MYVAEVGEDIFILDCGLKYPENELLGIDVVIPDFTYLEENIDRVAGVFLTHGHADAIGALPLLVVENFCTSIWNGVDDRVSKIECQS